MNLNKKQNQKKKRYKMDKENKPFGALSAIGLIVVVLFAIIGLGALVSSIISIEPGFVGIVFDKQTREINPIPLNPGWSLLFRYT